MAKKMNQKLDKEIKQDLIVSSIIGGTAILTLIGLISWRIIMYIQYFWC